MTLKILKYAVNIPNRATAETMLAEDLRFRDDWEKFIVVSRGNFFAIVHIDSCAKHPGYDADECPLYHREDHL